MAKKIEYGRFLHGGDYNPEQWLRYPEVLQEDIELMKKADINCVSVGIFSWAHLEPQEGVYDFDWLADVIDNLYKNGIYTVLATPSGAKPLWMSEKYEEIRRVQPSGLRELSGARHNHCYTSPVYREKVREMDRRLAEPPLSTTRRHPVAPVERVRRRVLLARCGQGRVPRLAPRKVPRRSTTSTTPGGPISGATPTPTGRRSTRRCRTAR